MTRRCLLVVSLALLCAAGCGQPLAWSVYPADSQDEDARGRCQRDLILVDTGRRDAGQADAANVEFPTPAVQASFRFTVATRGVRGGSKSTTAANELASDTAGRPPGPILVEGTGVVIDRRGLILTNHHVVRRVEDLRIWTPATGWVPARVVGADPLNDLAVVSVDQPLAFAARLVDPATARVGEPVVALGYSPGAEPADGPTALSGRLTGLHHSLQSALDPAQMHYYGDLIESTVQLEPGHSGGALIDASGSVIGINTAAVTGGPAGRRVGYAIPMSRYVRGIVARLARGEAVVHGYLGVLVCTCQNHAAGVPVEEVLPDSPAARAGLRAGDSILRIDDTPIRSAAHLAELVRSSERLLPMTLRVQRGRRSLDVALTAAVHPSTRR